MKLSDFRDAKQSSFFLPGWRYKVTVNWCLNRISNETSLIWNVEGTQHVFEIDIRTVTEKHGYQYEEHFKVTLTKFREDLIEWINLGLTEDWMKKYYNQFHDMVY